MAEWSVNKNSVLEPCVFTTGNTWTLGHLELANITAESLNFWLIKLVKEQSLILGISKFTG